MGGGDRWEPELLLDAFQNQIPASVSCGEGHTVVSTESYDVFAFGRAKDGQCAGVHGQIPKRLESLQHEIATKVATGAMTSYVLTASGKVYQFGLVHKEDCSSELNQARDTTDATDAAASGALTGLTESSQGVLVHADEESRAHSEALIASTSTSAGAGGSGVGAEVGAGAGAGRAAEGGRARAQVRELSAIVTDSRQR